MCQKKNNNNNNKKGQKNMGFQARFVIDELEHSM